MKKLLSLFIVFISSICTAENSNISVIDRLKEQVLLEGLSNVEVRDHGVCFFLPKAEKFGTKVAVNCNRLFDSLINEINSEEPGDIFEKSDLAKLRTSNLRKKLFQVLEGNLKVYSDLSKQDIKSESDKIDLLVLEISKIFNVVLSDKLGSDTQLQQLILGTLLKYEEDFVNIIILYRFEQNVASFLVNIANFTIKFSDEKDLAKLKFILAVISTTQDQLENHIVNNLALDKKYFMLKLDSLVEHNVFSPENEEIVNNLLLAVKKCNFEYNLEIDTCSSAYKNVSTNVKTYIDNSYFQSFKDFLNLNPNLGIKDILVILRPLVIFESNGEFYDKFLLNKISDFKFISNNDTRQICAILGINPCPKHKNLAQAQEVSSRSLYLVFVALGLTFIILYLKRAKAIVKKSDENEEFFDQQEHLDLSKGELTPHERSELRDLRKYFNLNPLDKVTDLHRSYRKMVFHVHPDKLKDGGREFILMQSRYLKAKDLLERLEHIRSLKLGNQD